MNFVIAFINNDAIVRTEDGKNNMWKILLVFTHLVEPTRVIFVRVVSISAI